MTDVAVLEPTWPPQLTDALRGPLPEGRGYVPETARRAALVANDHAMRAAAPAALAALKAAMRPATPDEISHELRRLLSVYHAGDRRSPDKWNDFWSIYQEGLEGLSLRSLKGGIKEFIRKSTTDYYPKPGVLRALCEPHEGGLAGYARTLELALAVESLAADADREQQHKQLRRIESLYAAALASSAPARRTPDTAKPWLNGSGNLAPPYPI